MPTPDPAAPAPAPAPTVGRTVHFFTPSDEPGGEPRAAIITAVHGEDSALPADAGAVDLYVFPPDAQPSYPVVRIFEVSGDAIAPEGGWAWPERV